VVERHELAAGKLAALIARSASRDLFDAREFLRRPDLDLEMLRADIRPSGADLAAWTNALIEETRELMKAVLPLRDGERKFLELLNGRGEVAPEFLTSDPTVQALLRTHARLAWKALNVREHTGSGAGTGSHPAGRAKK